ncbi:hypothetical protein D778_00280 [Xanthomarina gelatinilytica]|uniref:Uncharacterized protein n=1 Tax=Xanthomarina gelatinilytica TaxID=1137281 RepID=M7MJ82_9FLAO|nr:hypothetical protein D778_00280 [Xanthomarina gelatinilytica]
MNIFFIFKYSKDSLIKGIKSSSEIYFVSFKISMGKMA